MNLKFEDLQIDSDDPFRNDQLGRKEEIENLSTLIFNVNSPAVLAINSPWGTGKTTFIKMWEAFLKNKGVDSLYFNAWATDFSEDPLVSFLGEMNDGLSELIGASEESSKAWERTKAIGIQLAKRGVPAVIKIATAGVIDAEKIVEDEASKAMEALAGDALASYFQQKSAIAAFHESLAKLVSKSSTEQPVVVFVDELDRCRPTYAIHLLERIKHIFDIEGLVFVLALDKTQLGYSIGAVYGERIDASSYLRRFFDFEYQLKPPEIKEYVKSLFAALALDERFEPRRKYRELQYDREHLENVFLMLAERQRLSLREIEQMLASINLAVCTAKENEYIYPALLAFLVVAKNRRPALYRQYISASSSGKEIIDYLHEFVPEPERFENFECALIEGFLIAGKISRWGRQEPETLTAHKKVAGDSNAQAEVKRYSERVVNIASNPGGSGHGVNLENLVKRIEMLSQFQFESKAG